MKKFFAIALLASIASLAISCVEPATEETTDSVIKAGDMVFHAYFAEPQTKTALYQDGNALKINWVPGDKISILHNEEQPVATFVAQNSTPSPLADFSGTIPDVPAGTDPYYYAIYPHRNTGNYYIIQNNVPTLKPQLNSTQTDAQANNVGTKTVMVHVGRTDNGNIQMHNLCALFRFKIKDNDDVRRVLFRGNKNEGISGAFTVQFNSNGQPINISAGAKDSITLTPKNYTAFKTNQWYYMALLPTYFEDGITVTLYTSKSKATRSIRSIDFERNHCHGAEILDLETLQYTPALHSIKMILNTKDVTETTLWPHGTCSLSASAKGPFDVDPVGLIWTWESKNNSVATVSETGVVTGVSEGSAIIEAKTVVEGTEYTATCTVHVTEAASQLDAKAFTVDNGGTKVYFAAGNLRLSNGSFSFNTFQGQIVSYNTWDANNRDKFVWETEACIPQIIGSNTWQTLSYEQWDYLINTRNNSYAKATVNGIAGLLLLPDEYQHPSGVSALQSIGVPGSLFSENIYCGADWALLEGAGVVFLPAAGVKNSSNENPTSAGSSGQYWSCTTKSDKNAYRLSFSDSELLTNKSNGKLNYLSVRLVRVVTTN